MFVVAMTVFNHVPYEFFQAYLDLVVKQSGAEVSRWYSFTPAIASVHVALTMLIAGWCGRRAMKLQNAIGVTWSLLALMLLQGILIFAMSAIVHPLIAVALLLRSIPRGLMTPIVNAAIHPHITSNIRATFLSIQSLAGRLCFGSALFITSIFMVDNETMPSSRFSEVLCIYGVAVVVTLTILYAAQLGLPRTPATTRKSISR